MRCSHNLSNAFNVLQMFNAVRAVYEPSCYSYVLDGEDTEEPAGVYIKYQQAPDGEAGLLPGFFPMANARPPSMKSTSKAMMANVANLAESRTAAAHSGPEWASALLLQRWFDCASIVGLCHCHC